MRFPALGTTLLALVLPALAARGQGVPKGVSQRIIDEQALFDGNYGPHRFAVSDETGKEYRFSANSDVPPLESVWLPVDTKTVEVIGLSTLDPRVRERLVRRGDKGEEVLLLYRSDEQAHYAAFLDHNLHRESTSSLKVAPTASRSKVVWFEDDPSVTFDAKLSRDKVEGDRHRSMSASEVLGSVARSRVLQEWGRKGLLPDHFHFVRDQLGIVLHGPYAPRNSAGEEVGGVLYRAYPEELTSGTVRAVPLFALYSVRKGRSLLARALADYFDSHGIASAGERRAVARELLVERLIRPFATAWVKLSVELGISLVPHAQNLMVVLGKDGLPTGELYYRDQGDLGISLRYAEQAGLPLPKADLAQFFGSLGRAATFLTRGQHDQEVAKVSWMQGALANLELPRKLGLALGPKFLQTRLLEEIGKELGRYVGVPVTLAGDFADVEKWVYRARLAQLGRRPLALKTIQTLGSSEKSSARISKQRSVGSRRRR